MYLTHHSCLFIIIAALYTYVIHLLIIFAGIFVYTCAIVLTHDSMVCCGTDSMSNAEIIVLGCITSAINP